MAPRKLETERRKIKMKRLFNSILLAVALVLAVAGCNKATLQTGGAYSGVTPAGVTNGTPDMAFFIADSSFDLAYATLDGAFKFEQDNRATLWAISPGIKHTLDGIRPQAANLAKQYLDARGSYIANPSSSGLSSVNRILAQVETLAAMAVAVLPKK